MTPKWRTLVAVFLAAVFGMAVGSYVFQQVAAVYVHLKADHQAVHELAYIEMQRQKASQPKAAFDPAPPLQSK